MTGHSLGEFLAPESERVAREYFERVANGGHGNENGDGNGIDVAARAGESPADPAGLDADADRTGALRRDVSRHHREPPNR